MLLRLTLPLAAPLLFVIVGVGVVDCCRMSYVESKLVPLSSWVALLLVLLVVA